MSFPVIFEIAGHRLPAHFLFEVLAYTVGFRIYAIQRKRRGDTIDGTTRWGVIAAACIGAAAGAKILHHLAAPNAFAANWTNPEFLMSGKTIVGGLLGGLIAVEFAKPRLGTNRSTGDLFALPLCVGIAIGRIGCFLTGHLDDTVGIHTDLPIGIDFGDGPRHPAQLYEIVFLAVLAVVLVRVGRRDLPAGRVFATFMTGYLSFRFLIDFIKPYEVFAGLGGIQWACAAGLLHYARYFVRSGRPAAEIITP